MLAESLGSTLAALHALPERFPVGLELSCTHHRVPVDGTQSRARAVHRVLLGMIDRAVIEFADLDPER